MAGERTEKASPQRRDKARREGDILHSRELSSAAGTLAGVLLLGMAGPHFLSAWTNSLSGFLSYGAVSAWEPKTADATMRSLLSLAMTVLAPVGLVAAGVAASALGAGVLQTGGLRFHAQVLAFKPDRVNPLNNLKNLFSLRSAARLGKSMLPAALLAVFAVQRLARQWICQPSPQRGWLPSGAMPTTCCWPQRGCSLPGRQSTIWWSGAAASSVSR